MLRNYFKKAVFMFISFVMLITIFPDVSITVNAAYENTHINTGNQRADIVAIAQTQVGYHEGSLEGTTNGSDNYTKYNVELYKIEGSYKYMWCQSFIAWCAKQAGVSSSVIKRTAGTVDAMDFFKAQGAWKERNYTPQSGDIIYFYSSSSNSGYHVGIVESVSGSTINTIEGNYSNKVARHSVEVGNSSIVGYGVPNYIVPDPNPPTYSTLSSNKSSLTLGEGINFTASSDTATGYTIGIDKDGIRIITQSLDGNTFSFIPSEIGTYSAYVTSWNSAGYKDSAAITFNVSRKKDVNGFLPVDVGSGFIARIKNQSNGLCLTDIGDTIVGKEVSTSTSQFWKFERQTDGSYKIININRNLPMDVYGGETADGTDIRVWTDNDSDAQRFYIYRAYDSYYMKPLSSDKMVDMDLKTEPHNIATWAFGKDFAPQKFDIEKIDVNGFLPVDVGSGFIARIKNQSNGLCLTDIGDTIVGKEVSTSTSQFWKFERQTDGSYKIINQERNLPMDVYGGETADGTDIRVWTDNDSTAQRFYIYRAYDSYYMKPLCSDKMVDMDLKTETYNIATWAFGKDFAPQKFDIEKIDFSPTYSKLIADKTAVAVGEKIKFTASSDYASEYWIGIDNKDGRYLTKNMPDGCLSVTFDKSGEYSAYVTSSNKFGGKDSTLIKFVVFSSIEGDVNNDDKLTVADAVLLQKWLLAEPDVELSNWKAADLCEDGRLDVFDLCLMKRMLVENS